MPGNEPTTFIAPLLEALRRQPTSAIVTGTDREELTRTSLGLAERLDPACIWFDIRGRRNEPPSWHTALLARYPGPRHRTIYVDEMRLDEEAEGAVESVLDPNDPVDDSILSMVELMRIPASLREAAMEPGHGVAPRALLLTNVERASAAFDGAEGSLRPYIEALNRLHLTIVVTACSRPRANMHDADLVFRVEKAQESGRSATSMTCVMVRTPGLFPAIPPGARYAARAIQRRVEA